MLQYDYIYELIATNKDLLRFFYSMFIAFICLIIVIKTDRIFRISDHQGIRYFRNAFFFYGVAFVLRYFLINSTINFVIIRLFEFFMIMAGFFLLYSLVWKKFETKPKNSSLINPIIILFYLITLILVLLDYFWKTYNFMMISQIILFGFASMLSFKNYLKKGKEHKFTKAYFLVMLFNFFAWTLNFIFFNFRFFSRLRWMANVYFLNILGFLILFYGVIKITKNRK